MSKEGSVKTTLQPRDAIPIPSSPVPDPSSKTLISFTFSISNPRFLNRIGSTMSEKYVNKGIEDDHTVLSTIKEFLDYTFIYLGGYRLKTLIKKEMTKAQGGKNLWTKNALTVTCIKDFVFQGKKKRLMSI